MQPLTKYYCKECRQECLVGAIEEEYYPGMFTTLYCSPCCHAEIVDITSRFIPQAELKAAYIQELSFNIDPAHLCLDLD